MRPWIREGIIVKILSEALKVHGYYKKKAKIINVDKSNPYVAELSILDKGKLN